ncbi:MAG: DUF3426 domain-containing protein [Bauldia sp.]|nr:DUF3426 domain-containing protein [Bauldia sp.]
MERANRRAEGTALAMRPALDAGRAAVRDRNPLVIDLHPAFERPPPKQPAARTVARRHRGVLFALLAVAAVTAFVALRRPIVEIVPPLGPAFAAVGLPVNLAGVELDDLRASRIFRGGYEHLRVEGAIVSVAADTVTLPPVEVILLAADGAEIGRRAMAIGADVIAAGGTIRFATEFPDAPAAATTITVRLGDARPLEVL